MSKLYWSVFALFLVVAVIPTTNALAPTVLHNCSNGYHTVNQTAYSNGEFTTIYFINETCSLGCAYNNIECNSPQNIDRLGVVITALVFLVAGVLFFVFSTSLKEVHKYYKVLKYLHLFAAFVMLLTSVFLTYVMYMAGQNQITDMSWIGFFILLAVVLWTFGTIGFVEFQNWVSDMAKMGKKVK